MQDVYRIRRLADIAQHIHETSTEPVDIEYAHGVEEALRWAAGDGSTQAIDRLLLYSDAPVPLTPRVLARDFSRSVHTTYEHTPGEETYKVIQHIPVTEG